MNLKPCANPSVCGVQSHRPGTVCKAEVGGSASELSPSLASPPSIQYPSDPWEEEELQEYRKELADRIPDAIDAVDGERDDASRLASSLSGELDEAGEEGLSQRLSEEADEYESAMGGRYLDGPDDGGTHDAAEERAEALVDTLKEARARLTAPDGYVVAQSHDGEFAKFPAKSPHDIQVGDTVLTDAASHGSGEPDPSDRGDGNVEHRVESVEEASHRTTRAGGRMLRRSMEYIRIKTDRGKIIDFRR